MIDKPSIAILLEFGFHEIKKYIHSGFAEKLSQKANIVWIALNKNSSSLENYFLPYSSHFEYIDDSHINRKLSTIEKIAKRCYNINLITKYGRNFHNYKKTKQQISIAKKIISTTPLCKIFYSLATQGFVSAYYNHTISSIFTKYQVALLLTTSYSSYFSKNATATALKLNIPVHLMVNSWKDFFIDNYLPTNKYRAIYYWSEQMKVDFEQFFPALKKVNNHVVGNLTFDFLHHLPVKHDKSYYATKYGIPLHTNWIYYTMMPPGLVEDEIETIIFVGNALLKADLGDTYSIVVKLNPNHPKNAFSGFKMPDNVFITEQYCVFDEKLDMLIQSAEGEREWRDLLHHTCANFSVPSTVTLEFLQLNKKVFNIAFEKNNKVNALLDQFFEAPFYKPLFKKDERVKKVDSIEQLIKEIRTSSLSSTDEIGFSESISDKIITALLS